MAKHICENRFSEDGAKGACFFEIEPGSREGMVYLRVGWSCVIVHDGEVPVSWLAELVAIATGHKEKFEGFLREQNCGGGYALQCDPAVQQ